MSGTDVKTSGPEEQLALGFTPKYFHGPCFVLCYGHAVICLGPLVQVKESYNATAYKDKTHIWV